MTDFYTRLRFTLTVLWELIIYFKSNQTSGLARGLIAFRNVDGRFAHSKLRMRSCPRSRPLQE